MGVIFYSSRDHTFSDLYLDVRKIENRLYDDNQVKSLPLLQKDAPHAAEWKLRQYSTNRFINYLKSKKAPMQILDVGCGNGWFSHLMRLDGEVHVTGIDINLTELEQAARVFEKDNLEFVYADLFEHTELNKRKFDLVVFNSCLQYFENLPRLFEVLHNLLTPNGEIHIIDSPFYRKNDVLKAKQRTEKYFSDLGFPEMAENYFHHCFEDLGKYQVMHKPRTMPWRHLKKDSPFYWIKIENKSKSL